MKNILVIGAGRSSSSLIKYLLDHGQENDWQVTVADLSKQLAEEKTGMHERSRAIAFDIKDAGQREKEISSADIVISTLPAYMHMEVAKDCLRLKKNLFTASYVSPEMKALDKDVSENGLLFLNEMGLDPGLDHMSAMKIIDGLRKEAIEPTAFYSWCGGLIAPESNDNPWGYKFTWNPRNVILAGQSTAKYIENGVYKYIPYNRIFEEVRRVEVEGHGIFEGYANRDSLSYRPIYGLDTIPTMLRGTLRMPGFCEAWDALVDLGWTDDTYTIENSSEMTYAGLLNSFLPGKGDDLKKRFAEFYNVDLSSPVIQKLSYSGIFAERPIPLKNATPAAILQSLLEEKLKLKPGDKDMIVMQHEFTFTRKDKEKHLHSSLVVKGDDSVYTAMAKTVGLPVAIATKLMLQGKLTEKGVKIPVTASIYEPVLKELEEHGIKFSEKEI